MTINAEDKQPRWGTYKPKGTKRLIRALVKAHLSHGPVKKWLQKLWFSDQNQSPVDVEYFGTKFRLHPWDNVVERKITFGSKCRDCKEIHYLARHMGPESTFIDIGANIGYYTCSLATAGVGRIVAVEPHPVTLKRLQFNIASNGFNNVTVAPIALGDAEGSIQLTTLTGDLGSSSILNENKTGASEAYTVPIKPLKLLCDEMDIERIDALKIDVEGYEDRALIPYFESTPRDRWPRFIAIEHAHDKNWEVDVLASLEKYGYRGKLITRANTVFKLAG
jgi:FkbM family methyltransferase